MGSQQIIVIDCHVCISPTFYCIILHLFLLLVTKIVSSSHMGTSIDVTLKGGGLQIGATMCDVEGRDGKVL